MVGALHHLKWILVEAVINVYTTCIVVAVAADVVVVAIVVDAVIIITISVGGTAAVAAASTAGNAVEIHQVDVVVVVIVAASAVVITTSPVVVLLVLGEKLMLADTVVQPVKYRYIGRNLIGMMVLLLLLQWMPKIGVRLEDAVVLQCVCRRRHRDQRRCTAGGGVAFASHDNDDIGEGGNVVLGQG